MTTSRMNVTIFFILHKLEIHMENKADIVMILLYTQLHYVLLILFL